MSVPSRQGHERRRAGGKELRKGRHEKKAWCILLKSQREDPFYITFNNSNTFCKDPYSYIRK